MIAMKIKIKMTMKIIKIKMGSADFHIVPAYLLEMEENRKDVKKTKSLMEREKSDILVKIELFLM